MDLEKAYDRIDREAKCNMMRFYEIGGRLLQAVKSLYIGSKVCVKIRNEANDAVLVADLEEELCRLVVEFGRVCERRKLQVNVVRVRFIRCTRREGSARLNIVLNGELLEEVDQFEYLGSVIAANGRVEADVHLRVYKGCEVLQAVKGVVKNRGLGINVKRVLYAKVIVATVIYGLEFWGMKVIERQKLDVFQMKCLRNMAGVTQWDRVRQEVVRVRTGGRNELAARMDMNVLRWFWPCRGWKMVGY
ncbi:uncharacterized protein [Palaemon carinicauda]|uniref:uncharacterized protein n=1 Tax=Palaemon carinicauda TaxID=392227 RepID=UPI0035B5EAA8